MWLYVVCKCGSRSGHRAPSRTPRRQTKRPGTNPHLCPQRRREHASNTQVEWCASTEDNRVCNLDVVPMTSTPMQRVNGSDRLWATYIGVGGLSIPPGTNVSLGLRLRSSTEQRSAWCWSAGTMIGRADGLVKRGEGRGRGKGGALPYITPASLGVVLPRWSSRVT